MYDDARGEGGMIPTKQGDLLCVHLAREARTVTDRVSRLRIRRVLLSGAAVLPLFGLLDALSLHEHLREALLVRFVWGVTIGALGLAIPRASDRGVRVILGAVAGVCVLFLSLLSALQGGATSQYFQFLVAMPMCVAVCLPVEVAASIVAGAATLGCGLALMAWGGTPGSAMMKWGALCVMSSLLAVFACRTYRRLRDSEQKTLFERHEDLRRFATVVAHEFNNQLGVLQNTISLLGKTPQDPSLLSIQQDAVNHMRTLASDFTNFGRRPRDSRGPVDLVQLAHSYAQALAPDVEVTANADNPVVLGDSGSIARALLNVLKNGVEAGAPVKVTVDETNHGVAVRVRDRGPGVNSEVAARIGEPFFTTKARGTGLGIAIVREVVTQHDGHFSLYNCLKGGVLAELWFPHRHKPPRAGTTTDPRSSSKPPPPVEA